MQDLPAAEALPHPNAPPIFEHLLNLKLLGLSQSSVIVHLAANMTFLSFIKDFLAFTYPDSKIP